MNYKIALKVIKRQWPLYLLFGVIMPLGMVTLIHYFPDDPANKALDGPIFMPFLIGNGIMSFAFWINYHCETHNVQ